MILTEKQQRYQHYYLDKLVIINILQGKKILPSDRTKVIEQAKFIYSHLRKALEKQTTIRENKNHGKQFLKPNALTKKMIITLKINHL